MKSSLSISLLALLMLPAGAVGQDATPLPNAPSSQTSGSTSDTPQRKTNLPVPSTAMDPNSVRTLPAAAVDFGLRDKFHYYLTETYVNPGAFTAPAFRAGIRMANPPGRGTHAYPPEWRQGAQAFGRNYGDAWMDRATFQTARFVTGVITREDPRYTPSSSKNILARSVYALSFTFIDRSDSGRPMPAFSNFVGAAAGGFVGNAYLPAGFNDLTHAGQRATLGFGFFAASNLFREFAPQMPRPLRTFLILIAR